jgi:hypothetical protein
MTEQREIAVANPDDRRKRVFGTVAGLVRQGMSVHDAIERSGVSKTTYYKWLALERGPKRPKWRKQLQQVEIVSAAPPVGSWVAHGPYGLRVEGTDVADLVALWRALAC